MSSAFRWARIGVLLTVVPTVVLAAAPDEPITPIPAPPAVDATRAALGAALFADPRLSSDGSTSCLSCHDIGTNGATARARDPGPGGRLAPANTPTVFNASLKDRLNWSGNDRTLEAQAARAIRDPSFLGGDPRAVVARLGRDRVMRWRFAIAYGRTPDWAALLDAIATYERTLLTPDSAFDRWLGGDAAALTPAERDGYALFKTVGCASCHQGVLVGGNLFERAGALGPWNGGVRWLHVPSLRNVAVTPPYFDDGSAPTLAEAVRRMGTGQLGLALDDRQIGLITAFLNSLTGEYRGRRLTRPP